MFERGFWWMKPLEGSQTPPNDRRQKSERAPTTSTEIPYSGPTPNGRFRKGALSSESRPKVECQKTNEPAIQTGALQFKKFLSNHFQTVGGEDQTERKERGRQSGGSKNIT